MARVGRKPQAEVLVEQLDGSPRAKSRLAMIIKTMRQEVTVPQACQKLGIGQSRFHAMRNQWLQEALRLLEPRRLGRPASGQAAVDADRLHELQAQVDHLQAELTASQVRRQIAQVMPHALKEPDKKRGPSRRRRRRLPR